MRDAVGTQSGTYPVSMSLPTGWTVTGTATEDYEAKLDRDERHSGTACAVLRARKTKPAGYAALVQALRPDHYRDHRIRFAGWIKTAAVDAGWGGLWVRAEDPDGEQLAFDNMHARPIVGTHDWGLHEVVLDVPAPTEILWVGVALEGSGTLWFDDAELRIVGRDVPTTDQHHLPLKPRNLNFEE
jgi:hypothetical protein